MTLLTALLYLGLAYCIGRVLLPARTLLARSRWEETALSYLLGTATVVFVTTAGLAVGIPFAVLWWLPLCAGLGCGWRLWRQAESTNTLAASTFSKPLAALLVLLAVGSVAAALALPLNEFDPIYHFGYRGKVLLFDGSATAESIVGMIQADGYGRLVTHPNYPFGIPILEAWTAKLGGWDDRWVQLPLAFWTACMPLVIAFGLRRFGAKAANLGSLVAATTPMLYGSDYLAHGWVDLPRAGLTGEMMLGGGGDLAVATFFATGLALWLRLSSSWRGLTLCGLALAAGAMMKNEGLALAGCTILALLLGQVLPTFRCTLRSLAPVLRLAGVFALLIAPWLLLRAQLPAIDENYTERLNLENVMYYWSAGENPDNSPMGSSGKLKTDPSQERRLDHVLTSFWEECTDWRSWGLLWLLFLCALPVTRQRLANIELRQLCILVLGCATLYFLILLVTPWNYPSLRAKGIPERLLVHLVGVMSLCIGLTASLGQGKGEGEEA